MRTYGVQGLKAHIRSTVKLGELFHSLVLSRPDLLTVLTPPAFALTVITIVPRRASAVLSSSNEVHSNDFTPDAGSQATMEANALTKEVYELSNSRGEIFLTSAVVGGTYAIRVVSANPKAEEKYIRNAFEIIVRTAEEVLNKHAGEAGKMVNGINGV